jgi:hypothetical protein
MPSQVRVAVTPGSRGGGVCGAEPGRGRPRRLPPHRKAVTPPWPSPPQAPPAPTRQSGHQMRRPGDGSTLQMMRGDVARNPQERVERKQRASTQALLAAGILTARMTKPTLNWETRHRTMLALIPCHPIICCPSPRPQRLIMRRRRQWCRQLLVMRRRSQSRWRRRRRRRRRLRAVPSAVRHGVRSALPRLSHSRASFAARRRACLLAATWCCDAAQPEYCAGRWRRSRPLPSASATPACPVPPAAAVLPRAKRNAKACTRRCGSPAAGLVPACPIPPCPTASGRPRAASDRGIKLIEMLQYADSL